VERILARLASAAYGVVTRAELLAAGVSDDEIRHRLAIGALIRVYPGVYRVGHWAPSFEATYMAAVKACGEGAVVSGRAAAYLLGLLKGRPPPPEVTAPRLRQVRGVKVRRSKRIEAMKFRRVPVTTPARTLVDIAADLPEYELAKACHEAGVRFETTPRQIKRALARRPNVPGAGKLRRIMSGDTPVLLSRLEKGFRKLLLGDGLGLPEFNRRIRAGYVDCRWPERRLTVELNSYRFHNSRHSFEQDHRRERAARARGDDFRRYCWGDVFETPGQTLAELRKALGRVEPWPNPAR
jgi:Transcriptional regulator, AbiEi antitoxin